MRHPLGDTKPFGNDGRYFLFGSKVDAMRLDDVDRDVEHTAEADSGSLPNIRQVLARLQATGPQWSDMHETLPVDGDCQRG